MAGEPEAFSVGPEEGETIEGPVGGPLTFKARGAQTGGSLTAFENVIPPGEGPPLHRHRDEDEAWYVLEGELRFRLGETVAEAPRGSFVFVPRGTPHCFVNSGQDPARILVLFTPAGMESFFDALEDLDLDAPRAEAFGALGREAGMEVLGPPLAP